MEHLIQPQIREECRLSMPEGLKELMSDISREVLRAQPADIYGFIANYLSALLVTRDNLAVATQVCDHVYDCDCEKEMFRELVDLGLSDTDAKIAISVIMKFFIKNKVVEGNLMSVILAKTNIEAEMVPAVINAVRAAYLCHQSHNYTKYETSSGSDDDEVTMAAKHTLKLYRQTRPSEKLYNQMAQKIQTSYRAFGVRRALKSVNDSTISDDRITSISSDSSFSEDMKQEMELTKSLSKRRMNTVSSLSLAGSYCNLPKHKPYNVHEMDYLSQLEETSEKEHAHIDYTARSPHVSVVNDEANVDLNNKNEGVDFKEIETDIQKKEHDTAQETNYSHIDDMILITDEELDYETIQKAYDSVPNAGIDSDGYDGDINDDVSESKTAYSYVNVMNKEVDSDSDDDCD